MIGNHLSRDFFARDTNDVARALLGKLVVRRWRNHDILARIVEVESYMGEHDAASHASRGRTARTEIMFGEAGHAYIYFIYGMYWCLNIVTESLDVPGAILIRAAEPVSGVQQMQRWRQRKREEDLLSGPGKLCQGMHITGLLNGEDVTVSNRLWITEDGYRVKNKDIVATIRVGVDYAGKDALLPWRYYLRNNIYISRP